MDSRDIVSGFPCTFTCAMYDSGPGKESFIFVLPLCCKLLQQNIWVSFRENEKWLYI